MRIPKRLCSCSVLLLSVLLLQVQAARADEPAATSELPAALSALHVDQSRVLTATQASRVRGQNLGQGTIVQFFGSGVVDGGYLGIAGIAGGQKVTLGSTINGFSFQTAGIAVDFGPPEKQGVLATQTGVFNGGLSFQGSFESLTIVALPGLFGVDFQ